MVACVPWLFVPTTIVTVGMRRALPATNRPTVSHRGSQLGFAARDYP